MTEVAVANVSLQSLSATYRQGQVALSALGSLPFPLSPAEEGGQEDAALQQPKSLSSLYGVEGKSNRRKIS